MVARCPARCRGPCSPRICSARATTGTTGQPYGRWAPTSSTWWGWPSKGRATRWTRSSRARGCTTEQADREAGRSACLTLRELRADSADELRGHLVAPVEGRRVRHAFERRGGLPADREQERALAARPV